MTKDEELEQLRNCSEAVQAKPFTKKISVEELRDLQGEYREYEEKKYLKELDLILYNTLDGVYIHDIFYNEKTGKFRDYDSCLEEVKKDGLAIQHVPLRYIDRTLYLTAIRQNGLSILFLRPIHLSYDLYLEAVKQNCYVIKYLPEGLLKDEIAMIAVSKDPELLGLINESNQTLEMCIEAVSKSRECIKFVKIEI